MSASKITSASRKVIATIAAVVSVLAIMAMSSGAQAALLG